MSADDPRGRWNVRVYNALRERAVQTRKARIVVSYNRIAQMVGCSRRQAIDSVADLMAIGWLRYADDRKEGGRKTNQYVVMPPERGRRDRIATAAESLTMGEASVAELVFPVEQMALSVGGRIDPDRVESWGNWKGERGKLRDALTDANIIDRDGWIWPSSS